MAVCIQEMIERRQVCYEVWPEWAIVNGLRVQVGFELDICAPAPGDDSDRNQFDNLKDLVASVLPPGQAAAGFEILPFDNSIHESPRRGFRPEIVLGVHILHQKDPEQPVDDSEQAFLHEVERRLHEAGIPRAN